MKKILTLFLICFLSLGALSISAFATEMPAVSAKAAIIYEPVTQSVLYEKNADERMLVASTTKIMTALIVLENCDASESVKITAAQAGVEGSSMYLKAGETYTVGDLLYGMMLASGNDAATALAEHTAGSMEAFAELMNAKCDELGLQNSHFENSHGLDADGHYSSARDLALITAAAMQSEDFCEIFGTASYTTHGLSYYNHNKLLNSCEGCIGGKTGYTEAAGRSLVSCVERGGMTLVCVTISAPDDWNDHRALYNACYAEYEFIPVLDDDMTRLEVISGTSKYVGLKPDISGIVAKKDVKVTKRIILPSFVFSPVNAGDTAGQVWLSVEGKGEIVSDIIYTETVFVDKSMILTPWERIKRAWNLACRYGVYYPEN